VHWWIGLTSITCGLLGAWIGERSGRGLSGLLWGLTTGPIGVFVVALGHRPQYRPLDDYDADPALAAGLSPRLGPLLRPAPAPGREHHLPVEAFVDGTWQEAQLERFRQSEHGLEGLVRCPPETEEPVWMPASQIRRHGE
jgi:hypothetical protein